jgi:KaiC/GvpD/RAD55 family RecA-like ATPase
LSVLSKYRKLRKKLRKSLKKLEKHAPKVPISSVLSKYKKTEEKLVSAAKAPTRGVLSKYKKIRKEFKEKPEAPVPLHVPTGIPGLDEVIGGGFPEKSVIIFAGSAGTGKTTLSARYIYEGATRFGDKGLYVCLSETKEKFLRNMKRFGWNFERLEKTGTVSVLSLATAREVELQSNLNVIMREINEQKPQRVVIDPLTAMTSAMETRIDARFLTHVLYKFLENANCTAILTAEMPMGSDFIGAGVEEFIADGVFVLKRAENAGRMVRKLEIVKLRGADIEEFRHLFTLLGGPQIIYKRDEANEKLNEFLE